MAGFVVLLVARRGGDLRRHRRYARSTYYVGFAGDQVAIYKGRPDGVLWFKPTLRERKPLTRAEVPAIYLADVEKGKQVDSKAAADRYVTNLRDKHLEEEAAGRPTSTTTPTTTVPAARPRRREIRPLDANATRWSPSAGRPSWGCWCWPG